jgi:regulator of ribosome biosynthesis
MEATSKNVVKISPEMLNINNNPDSTNDTSSTLPSNVSFDLGNLLCSATLDIPIKRARDSAFLALLAQEHTQFLMNELCQLPSEPSPDYGRFITLPKPTTRLPREKPIPKDKDATRWEKFAKQKGITKRKRDRQVFDEEHGEWKERYGSNKANDKSAQWAIEHNEVKSKFAKENPSLDPWSILDMEKQQRVGKNKKQQAKNMELSATTQRKGSAPVMDLSSVIGANRPSKRNAQHKTKELKTHVDVALAIAQKSTNSMGKFDKLRKGEERVKHKKASDMVALGNYDNERKLHQNVMRKVLGKEKEGNALNVQKAMHALGVTSIDKGEVRTARAIKARNKLQTKMKDAQTTKKNSRVNARIKHNKGKTESKGGKKKGGRN